MRDRPASGLIDYRQLRVYRDAFDAANVIFRLADGWPPAERYMLSQQIIRSSRSVGANIGEAWFKKKYPKHFVAKLNDAGSEAMETLVWLEFALKHEYVSEATYSELTRQLRGVTAGLIKMSNQPEKWCFPSSRPETTD
ncbi:MAG: four helix bundle protein [Bacteroidetes bacterium]|nr:four helix bundle protein [Bacteroidota bacterium]